MESSKTPTLRIIFVALAAIVALLTFADWFSGEKARTKEKTQSQVGGFTLRTIHRWGSRQT